MKQILTSKMLRKFLILSCLIVGLVFVTASSNVQEASAAEHDDYGSCTGEAYDAYKDCDYYCGTVVGTGACFGMCQTNLDNSLRDCEAQYPQ